jgi:hypothetical protein
VSRSMPADLRAGVTERLRLALAALAAGDLDAALRVIDDVRDELLERRRRALAVIPDQLDLDSIEKFSRRRLVTPDEVSIPPRRTERRA